VSRPHAISLAAAVDLLIIRRTFKPVITPASLVACHRKSLKYARSVIIAFVTVVRVSDLLHFDLVWRSCRSEFWRNENLPLESFGERLDRDAHADELVEGIPGGGRRTIGCRGL